MEGNKTEEEERGIIPRTFEHIIKSIEGTPNVTFILQVSMLELYNEEVVDLLSGNRKSKLQIHEDKDKGVYVKDLKGFEVKTIDDMNKKLKEGSKSRHVGSTEMNSVSSRSHSIFMIRIEQMQEINK
jgi:kinesin family protein 3/17